MTKNRFNREKLFAFLQERFLTSAFLISGVDYIKYNVLSHWLTFSHRKIHTLYKIHTTGWQVELHGIAMRSVDLQCLDQPFSSCAEMGYTLHWLFWEIALFWKCAQRGRVPRIDWHTAVGPCRCATLTLSYFIRLSTPERELRLSAFPKERIFPFERKV